MLKGSNPALTDKTPKDDSMAPKETLLFDYPIPNSAKNR